MPMADKFAGLKRLLVAIQAADRNYDVRYGLILAAVSAAHETGLAAGYRFDADDTEWPVAFIELPTGQVSWHVPQHDRPWDGHTTQEKYARIQRFLQVG